MTPVALAEQAVANTSCCSCNWKELTALVIAVVGVALSIFTSSIFGTIGFALFGIVILVKHFDQMQTVSQLEMQVKNTLDTEEKKIEKTSQEMSQKVDEIEKEKNQFSIAVQKLTQDNERLQKLQQDLATEEQKLNRENETLGKTKADLERELALSKASVQQIQGEVKNFIAENLRLGEATGAFGKNVEVLNGLKGQLEQEAAGIDGDVKKLIQQIQIVKNASSQIIEVLSHEEQTLNQNLTAIRAGDEQRQKLGQELKDERNRLETLDQTLQKKETEIAKLEEQSEENRKKLKEDSTILETRTQELKEEEKEMGKTIEKLNETVHLKEQLIKALDATILKKRQELKDIGSKK